LAVRYAVAEPRRVRALVLCASFVCAPAPRWLRHLVFPLLFRLPPPDGVVRRLMVGTDASAELVREVKSAVRRVSPAVLARRLRDVLTVDCSDDLRRCDVPILWLAPTSDKLIRPADVAGLGDMNPGLTVRAIEGPHLLLQARPAAAWLAVEDFLAGARAG
jgi:pimeloyl-ACP methyl ester carboxylesterase